jgi:alkanesulfonate monooxygenase SsuD/methylene tetrahydromethanopterin reductase-like flavin-dependent oxidoreductase (luciferase family)
MALLPARPIRFGISLPNRAVLFGVSPTLLIETAETADSSGFFDSVWVGDNLLSKPRLESIVTLSALAGRTSRLKLGEVCLASFPLRHPLLLAIQWASLDVISGGRTILVVCIGGSARSGPQFAAELAAMGVGSNERVPRLEDGIALLRAF